MSFPMAVNGLTGMTIILVGSATSSTENGGAYGCYNSAIFWDQTANWGTVYLGPFQSLVRYEFGTGQVNNLPSYTRPATIGSGFSLTEAIKSGTTESLYVGGQLVLTQTGKLATIANIQNTGNLGVGYLNTHFAGQIAEVLVYKRALTAAERQQVEQYLYAKYFVPTSGLGLWLKAEAGVTLNGSGVSQWADQSGQGHNATQPTAAAQPTLVSGAINGRPAVSFNGSTDMQFPLPVNGLSGMTMFLVNANGASFTGGAANVYNAPIFWDATANWGTVYLSPFEDSVKWEFGTGQANNMPSYTRPATIGTAFTLTDVVKNGTTERLFVRGALVATQTGKLAAVAYTQSTGNLGVGYLNTHWNGKIAEVLVYTVALSDTQRRQVEQYLKSKYGL